MKRVVYLFLAFCFAWTFSLAASNVYRQPKQFTNLSGFTWTTTTVSLGGVYYSRASTTFPISIPAATTTVTDTWTRVPYIYFAVSSTQTISLDSGFTMIGSSARLGKTSLRDATKYFFVLPIQTVNTALRIICSTPSKLPTGTFSFKTSGVWDASAVTYTLASSTAVITFTDVAEWATESIVSGVTGYNIMFSMSSCTAPVPVITTVEYYATTTSINKEYVNMTNDIATVGAVHGIIPSTATETGHWYIGFKEPVNSVYFKVNYASTGPNPILGWYKSTTNSWSSITRPSYALNTSRLIEFGSTAGWIARKISDDEAIIPTLGDITTNNLKSFSSVFYAQNSTLTIENDSTFLNLTAVSASLGSVTTNILADKHRYIDFNSIFYSEFSTGREASPIEADTTFLDLTTPLSGALGTVVSIGTTAVTDTCYLFLGFGVGTTVNRILTTTSTAFSGTTVQYAYSSANGVWGAFSPTGNRNLAITGLSVITVGTLGGLSVDTCTTGGDPYRWIRIMFTGASTTKDLGLDKLQFDFYNLYTSYLYLGFGVGTTMNRVQSTISTAFVGDGVIYSYNSTKTWVAFTPTGKKDWNTTGLSTMTVGTLAGLSVDTMTTAQSALRYIRVGFCNPETTAFAYDMIQVDSFTYSSTSGLYYLRVDTIKSAYAGSSIDWVLGYKSTSTAQGGENLHYSFNTIAGAVLYEYNLSTDTVFDAASESAYTSDTTLYSDRGYTTPLITQAFNTVLWGGSSCIRLWVSHRPLDTNSTALSAYSFTSVGKLGWLIDVTLPAAPTLIFGRDTASLIANTTSTTTTISCIVQSATVNIPIASVSVTTAASTYNWVTVPYHATGGFRLDTVVPILVEAASGYELSAYVKDTAGNISAPTTVGIKVTDTQ